MKHHVSNNVQNVMYFAFEQLGYMDYFGKPRLQTVHAKSNLGPVYFHCSPVRHHMPLTASLAGNAEHSGLHWLWWENWSISGSPQDCAQSSPSLDFYVVTFSVSHRLFEYNLETELLCLVWYLGTNLKVRACVQHGRGVMELLVPPGTEGTSNVSLPEGTTK